MASSPEYRDDTDTVISGAISLSADPGAEGTAETVRLYNSFAGAGGVDPLQDARLIVLVEPSPGAAPVASGVEALDRYFVEARIVSGLGGLSVTATGWTKLGPGANLLLPPSIASGEGVELELRYAPAPDAQASSVALLFSVVAGVAVADDAASMESGGGIVLGVGDGETALVVSGTATVEDGGGPSGSVQVGPFVWIYDGVPYSYPQQLVALTPAASGEQRYDLLSLSAGTLTVTSGAETASALTDDDKPAIPTGHLAVAYVEVDDASTITTADIEDAWLASLYAWSDSGLTATFGPGPVALAGSVIVYHSVSQSVTLTASSTNSVWLTPAGVFAVTSDGTSPQSGSVLLWEATTDGSGVTATRDLRRFAGGRVERVVFAWSGTLSAAAERYGIAPQRDTYIVPIRGLRAALGDPGTGTGQTAFDLEVDDGGWASLAGTDRPPAIAQGAADPRDEDARPAAFAVPAGRRLRATVDEVPSTPSEDAVLEVTLWG